ncbi:MAG: type II toxin-antitoxin system HicA family toxin [Tepidiformaceae bacterium]
MLRAAEVVRALNRLGFKDARQRGSHVILKHPDGRWVPVPVHGGRDVDRSLLRSILREASASIEEFLERSGAQRSQ